MDKVTLSQVAFIIMIAMMIIVSHCVEALALPGCGRVGRVLVERGGCSLRDK